MSLETQVTIAGVTLVTAYLIKKLILDDDQKPERQQRLGLKVTQAELQHQGLDQVKKGGDGELERAYFLKLLNYIGSTTNQRLAEVQKASISERRDLFRAEWTWQRNRFYLLGAKLAQPMSSLRLSFNVSWLLCLEPTGQLKNVDVEFEPVEKTRLATVSKEYTSIVSQQIVEADTQAQMVLTEVLKKLLLESNSFQAAFEKAIGDPATCELAIAAQRGRLEKPAFNESEVTLTKVRTLRVLNVVKRLISLLGKVPLDADATESQVVIAQEVAYARLSDAIFLETGLEQAAFESCLTRFMDTDQCVKAAVDEYYSAVATSTERH